MITQEDIELDQHYSTLKKITSVESYSQNAIDHKEHEIIQYQFVDAVEAFENNNRKDTMFYLCNFSRVSLNDFYTYTSEFDESGFSDHLINFLELSTNIDILYATLNILLNLTHYETEFNFLFSLIQRELYNKFNFLLQNPINVHVSRKIFSILSNISLSSKENRDEILSNIDFSILVNPKNDNFFNLKIVFCLISNLFYFPLDREMQINLFNLIFPYLYNRFKEDGESDFKIFISFLYNVKNHFDDEFFDFYLMKNNVFTDLNSYFIDFAAIKQKTKLKILSIYIKFLPMKPIYFKFLTSLILDYVKKENPQIFVKKFSQLYSYLMKQLFIKYKDIFQIDELQQIFIVLLKYENNLAPELKYIIGFIIFHSFSSLPPDFSHSNLNLLYDACNDWIKSDCNELQIHTLNLVILIQNNEDLFEKNTNFLSYFVAENMEIINKFANDDKIDHNLKVFASLVLHCFHELND